MGSIKTMIRSIIIIHLVLLGMFFSGCGEKTLEEQKAECIKEGKRFYVKKVLNHRTGEYEQRGICK